MIIIHKIMMTILNETRTTNIHLLPILDNENSFDFEKKKKTRQ